MAFVPYKIANLLEVRSHAIFIFESFNPRDWQYIFYNKCSINICFIEFSEYFSHTSMNQGWWRRIVQFMTKDFTALKICQELVSVNWWYIEGHLSIYFIFDIILIVGICELQKYTYMIFYEFCIDLSNIFKLDYKES